MADVAGLNIRDVVVGFEVPPHTRTPNFHHWNRYAAVNSEFVDIHMDDQAGQAAGYPGAIQMGNLTFAWLYGMLRDWLGFDGRIVKVECRFRRPTLKGDSVTCKGVVTRCYLVDGVQTADLDVWTENQNEVRTTEGKATVALQPV
jgi:acyl dehydratase